MKANQALRFLTAGSVDDGKSTLIGRLLYDSRAILTDQLDALHAKAQGQAPDLSLLTDGLEAEREQGITIDVAYRYFSTKQRKFIIADAPGHEQYTRNMVTAAAGSDAAVVLVDATKLNTHTSPVALLPQTRRHALLAQLLRVRSIVFAVNKLDAVGDPGQVFHAVKTALQAFAEQAGLQIAATVPVSALRGDNITQPLVVPWYAGPSLLQVLESLPAGDEHNSGPLALPLQYIRREGDGTGHQPRVHWGRIAQGQVRVGDTVQVFPSGQTAVVSELRSAGLGIGAVATVAAGRSAGVVLDRQLDISRGDWLLAPDSVQPSRHFDATLAWLDTEPAVPGRKYWLRHGHRWVQARLRAITHALDIHTLQPQAAQVLSVNEIGRVSFDLQTALPLAPFAHNRVAGALIVVDDATHRTSGALLVESGL
jgi:sulfate adenylyltransferase subunit 1